MDDRRFDSLVKALAEGKSRRSVLKGILGLGGAAIAGGALVEREAEAARRPPSTPTPLPKCPGKQTLQGGVCVCPPSAPNKCGPDCCTGKTSDPYPRAANHTECCDNACCNGTCYGEELCCPTGRTFCEATGECCPIGQPYCCGAAGCCATPCCSTSGGIACCEGDTPKCCPGDICIAEGGCCSVTDCGLGNCWSCVDHVCVSDVTKCNGCLDCQGGTCTPLDRNCADGDPCTRSTCSADGSCSDQVFDCRQDGCTCAPSDPCHRASCDQDSGQCTQIEQCTRDCCGKMNPDPGCLQNPECWESSDSPSSQIHIGVCWYDVFCADACCATFFGQDWFCVTEGDLAGQCGAHFK